MDGMDIPGGTGVTVLPEALRSFGATAAATSSAVASAGTIDAAASTAAVAPVFGVIGQEFLAAFAVAQANHLAAVGRIASVHAGTASATSAALARFEACDVGSGATLRPGQ